MEDRYVTLLQRIKLFKSLKKEELKTLAQSVKLKSYNAGDVIIAEGEIGDCLYIIESGAVRVFTFDKEGNEIVLARLQEEQYFGEQAILTSTPLRRNASVRALSALKTITVSHEAFQRCLQTNSSLLKMLKEFGTQQLITKLVRQLHSNDKEQKKLFSLFQNIKNYSEREVFFRYGDPSHEVFYLLSGEVEVRFHDNDNRVISHNLIYPGRFFGELGVIKGQPRSGTAVAVRDSQVAKIDATELQRIYGENPQLRSLLNAGINLYQIPLFGTMTQYLGQFLGQSAVNTSILKPSGEVIIASRVVNSDIFAISYLDNKQPIRESFDVPLHRSRQLLLSDNHLVGVVSIGQWDDLNEIVQLIYEKPLISPPNLQEFHRTGKLMISSHTIVKGSDILCECMQVKATVIQQLILEGVTELETISKITGAGTVCGGCRPRIKELLGGEVWITTKISAIREHNSYIRSYQFKPINGGLTPPQAGQHIIIEAYINDHWVIRSYTLTSTDDEKDYYEITVKAEDQGLFSRWLFTHGEIGTILRVTQPEGTFLFPYADSAPALCFMAGIGITPAIAFVRKLISSNQKKRIHIDYSIHQQDDLAFRDELSEWPKRFPTISVKLRITKLEGRIQEQHIQQLLKEYPTADIFICGPTSYENMITKALKRADVAAEKIHLERFTHSGGPLLITT